MLRFLLLLLFAPSLLSAQLEQHLNEKIGLAEDLNSKELRVYKVSDITNYVSLFRLYQNEEQIWKAVHYECHFIHEDDGGDDFRHIELPSSKELNYVWLEILNSDVLYLPKESVFRYKLKSKARIENVEGKYERVVRETAILDGSHYLIQVRDGEKENSFEYDNPETYHKHYPDVDELQSFVTLKKILKKRFAVAL